MKLNPYETAESLPKRSELPAIPGAPSGAAWFWGSDDQHGRLNLLTPERIRQTTVEHVKTGEVISLRYVGGHHLQHLLFFVFVRKF